MPPPLRRAPLHLLAVLLALLSPPGGAALQPDCREQYRHRYATEAPPAAVTVPSGAPSGAAAGAAAGAGAARGWPRPFADSAALRGAGETGYVPDSSASLQGATSDVLPALAPSPGLGGLSPRGQGRNLRQLAPSSSSLSVASSTTVSGSGVGIFIDPRGKFGAGDPTRNDPLSVTSLWGIPSGSSPGGRKSAAATTLGVRTHEADVVMSTASRRASPLSSPPSSSD